MTERPSAITADDRARLIALPGRLADVCRELEQAREAAERICGPTPPGPGWGRPGEVDSPLEAAARRVAGTLPDACPCTASDVAEALAVLLRQEAPA